MANSAFTVPAGFAIGSSFLSANHVDQDGITSGVFTNAQWTLLDSAGSDISIDGGDNTKINIATTGWYSIWHQVDFGPDTTGPITSVIYSIRANGTTDLVLFQWEMSATAYQTIPISVPARQFTAGDYFQLGMVAESGADTWDFTNAFNSPIGDLYVARMS